MKRFLIIAMSAISVMFSTSALAESQISINSQAARKIAEITPYDLVTAGYQGRLSDRGIPSASRFVLAVRANKIRAEDLVKVAIAKGRLSESTLNDRAYLHHVKSIMSNLDKN